MGIQKAIGPLVRRISNMLSRGTVTLGNSTGNLQTLQVSLLDEEGKDAVEHFEPFGFTAAPVDGAEVLAAFIEGDRSHGIIIAATDRRYRVKNLKAGESAAYNAFGMTILLTKEGIVITGGAKDISISGAPNINISSGTVHVTGGDVIADGIGLKTHHHNEHDGPATSAAIA